LSNSVFDLICEFIVSPIWNFWNSTKPSNNLLWPWKKVFEMSIWSIMVRIARFYFWIENFSFDFSSNRSTVLFSMLFPTIYNMWVFIMWDHQHHFQFWNSGETRVIEVWCCSNRKNFKFGPSSFCFLIGVIYFLIFLISLLLSNCFSKTPLSKLHQNLLKNLW
jgi:hypothetical protein